VTGEQRLRHVLKCYMEYYNAMRTHLSFGKIAPNGRAVQRRGRIEGRSRLDGLWPDRTSHQDRIGAASPVRMMKITRIWVSIDSANRTVRNWAMSAWIGTTDF
jgi:hypothetical protein